MARCKSYSFLYKLGGTSTMTVSITNLVVHPKSRLQIATERKYKHSHTRLSVDDRVVGRCTLEFTRHLRGMTVTESRVIPLSDGCGISWCLGMICLSPNIGVSRLVGESKSTLVRFIYKHYKKAVADFSDFEFTTDGMRVSSIEPSMPTNHRRGIAVAILKTNRGRHEYLVTICEEDDGIAIVYPYNFFSQNERPRPRESHRPILTALICHAFDNSVVGSAYNETRKTLKGSPFLFSEHEELKRSCFTSGVLGTEKVKRVSLMKRVWNLLTKRKKVD